MNPEECQFASLLSIAEGNARMPSQHLIKSLKLFFIRHSSKRQFAVFYRYYRAVLNLFLRKKNPSTKLTTNVQTKPVSNLEEKQLKAGDMVRVRSIEEIEATLDDKRQTRGCGFMNSQWSYCGTVQRVFKPMERFVEERDFTVKKCKGMVLLEGVICEGVERYGRCDRSCLIFWREEWLEKI